MISKIDEKIVSILLKPGFKNNDHSLMNGNLGKSIYFYNLHRQSHEDNYFRIAEELITEIFKNLNSQSPAEFETGLSGIGWGIEYLVQNKFVEGDTDDILEEIDDKVFKILNEENFASIELTNGLTGYLFYLSSRLRNSSDKTSNTGQINRELFFHLINKIYEEGTSQFPMLVKDLSFDLFWRYPLLLYGLSEAFSLNLYNEKISIMIKQWMPCIDAYIPALHINKIYMAAILMNAYHCTQLPGLEKQAKVLLYATDYYILTKEINPGYTNIRYGWPGFIIILKKAIEIIPSDFANYYKMKEAYNCILNKYLHTLQENPFSALTPEFRQFGLSEGLAGIGLFCLLMPEIFEKINKHNTYDRSGQL